MRIAFIGKMMSGKTTAAEYLVRHHHFTRLAFADPVKTVSANMLNILSMHIHGNDFFTEKEHFWDYDRIQAEKGDPAIRKLLQLVGTELGRELIGYENVWVDLLINQVNHYDHVVVDDCRFPNEAQALQDNGFTMIRVQRPEADRIDMIKRKYSDPLSILSHPSETSLDNFQHSYTLSAQDIDQLYDEIERMLDVIENNPNVSL